MVDMMLKGRVIRNQTKEPCKSCKLETEYRENLSYLNQH